MATKAQVLKRAQQLGCSVELDSLGVSVIAPHGYLVAEELHASCWEFDGYTKSEIWSNILCDLEGELVPCEGSRYCTCNRGQA